MASGVFPSGFLEIATSKIANGVAQKRPSYCVEREQDLRPATLNLSLRSVLKHRLSVTGHIEMWA